MVTKTFGHDRHRRGARKTGNLRLVEAEGVGWERGMEQQDTRGTSSSGQPDNPETWEETNEKCLYITLDELWKL